MNLEPIKQELKAELQRIQSALSALDELDGVQPVRKYRAVRPTTHRHMSAEARKRISMAQKARWAKQRKDAA